MVTIGDRFVANGNVLRVDGGRYVACDLLGLKRVSSEDFEVRREGPAANVAEVSESELAEDHVVSGLNQVIGVDFAQAEDLRWIKGIFCLESSVVIAASGVYEFNISQTDQRFEHATVAVRLHPPSLIGFETRVVTYVDALNDIVGSFQSVWIVIERSWPEERNV